MSDLRKAAKMALDALHNIDQSNNYDAIEALRQALSQPEQMTDKEKVAQWMIQQGYATGHGDTVEDLLKELEWQIAENWTNALVKGVEGEREACAEICDKEQEFVASGGPHVFSARRCATNIRARSEK